METTINFEIAVYLSWLAGMLLINGWKEFMPAQWPVFVKPEYHKPVKEFMYAILVCCCLIVLSVISYISGKNIKALFGNGNIVWFLKILVIYSPVFIYLLITKQKLSTCYISFNKIKYKLLIGIFSAMVAGYIFISVRGVNNYPAFLEFIYKSAGINLIQTLLEGVAVGFFNLQAFCNS